MIAIGHQGLGRPVFHDDLLGTQREIPVSWALMLFGLATVVGNFLGGWMADALGIKMASLIVLVGTGLALLALPLSVQVLTAVLANLFFWGVFAFAISPIVQAGVVHEAQRVAPGAVATASGFNIAAFNLGIAGASYIGGAVISGPGIGSTPWVAAASIVLAFGLAAILRDRKSGGADPLVGRRAADL